jgi:AmmeMemoRadiSam system protein B
MTLDFMPSPSREDPGLFIRDPYKFSDAMLIVPPPLVGCLECFDGRHTDLDLRAVLARITGRLETEEIARNLTETLSNAGFLEDEIFARMQSGKRREFAGKPVREPAHAGSAYPADPAELRETMVQYMADGSGARDNSPADGLFAIAAPHVSPSGGWESYQAAYRMLRPEHRDRTFVILATSHYGTPEQFGLTRKPFQTPLGESETDTRLVDWLAERAGGAIEMEDYCHSFEHTIELQMIFLQHLMGANVKVLPILCGSYAQSIYRGGKPEDNDGVKRFLDALTELRDREGDRLFWILGVDMAHMGARYQDKFECRAGEGVMQNVADRDEKRIGCINALDAEGFWSLVQERHDDLKWCGSSPFYTFLKTAPKATGELLRYEQWNIDERSVVSFAGMAFRKAGAEPRP